MVDNYIITLCTICTVMVQSPSSSIPTPLPIQKNAQAMRIVKEIQVKLGNLQMQAHAGTTQALYSLQALYKSVSKSVSSSLQYGKEMPF